MISAAAFCTHAENLPFADFPALAHGPVLILAPHPDDESLGCGGFIAQACARGQPPLVAIVTDGDASHPGSKTHPPARLAALRREEARLATSLLGLPDENLFFLGLPDSAVPVQGAAFHRLTGDIVALATRCGAAAILATLRHDPHCDHQATQRAAAEASRITGLPLIEYPVWTWMLAAGAALPGDAPQGFRLAIDTHLPAKRQAIAAHRSQHGEIITDSPDAFVLPPAFLQHFDRPYEVFITAT
jgi:LmbE family N-acetylglucosaminyl deacetylase